MSDASLLGSRTLSILEKRQAPLNLVLVQTTLKCLQGEVNKLLLGCIFVPLSNLHENFTHSPKFDAKYYVLNGTTPVFTSLFWPLTPNFVKTS